MQQTFFRAWHLGAVTAPLALIALPGLADAATAEALLPRNLSPWGMFLNADIVVKAVMIGLAFASLVTWTVWLAKTLELQRATARAKRRLRTLEQGGSLRDVVRAFGNDTDAVA